jgi:outer membrane protein assembly factor BamE (lipoprotein component of BamABCDE complex)
MKTISYLVFILATVLFAGCHHVGQIRGSSLTDIKLGMTEQDVIGILGKPQGVSAEDNYETYRYFVDLGNWRNAYYNFIFVDGKLNRFGVAETVNVERHDLKIKVDTNSK